MGIFDIFKGRNNKKEEVVYAQQPPNYWEEYSFMQIVPKTKGTIAFDDDFKERLSQIDGAVVKELEMPVVQTKGKIVLDYAGEEFEVVFYPAEFTLHEMLQRQNQFFTEAQMKTLAEADSCIVMYMKFKGECKSAYQLQLKIAAAMIPGFAGLVDESAEKLLCYDWVKMAAESKVLPSSKALFVIQAVYDEKSGEVWLHTHGLARCGLTELEILQSDREHYNEHAAVINTLASRLLDNDNMHDNTAYIGRLTNGEPIVTVFVPWTEGLHEYKKLKLGGADAREEEHGGDTSLIFFYRSEDDEKNKHLRKISELDKDWGDNPLFFISNEETERMSQLARERFEYLKMHAGKENYHILIKVGLKTGLDDVDREHIWFELKGFEGDSFRAELTQEPYADLGMHTGDEGVYTVDDVTDWIVYTPKVSITPETAYLLRISL